MLKGDILKNQKIEILLAEFVGQSIRRVYDEDSEFACLTNIIHQEWSGVSVKEHKRMNRMKS